jgi:hypothetical protein
MSTWESLLLVLGAAGLIWFTYAQVKRLPRELFSSASIHRSIYVLGILTLGLIIFIWVLVKLLKM